MALSPYKTWSDGEVLTHTDLNASFSHICDNAASLFSPMTGNLDMDGYVLVIDSDADSTFRATADDVVALRLQGFDAFIFDGDVSTPVNGITFTSTAAGTAPSLTAQGSDTDIGLRLIPKGTGGVTIPTGALTVTAGNIVASAGTISATSTAAGNMLTLESSEAGATFGPGIKLYRNSATPAASDIIGQINFHGEDTNSDDTQYAYVKAVAVNVTHGGTEAGRLVIGTLIANSATDVLTVQTGVQIGAPTGGDKGANTLNVAGAIYQNAVAVALTGRHMIPIYAAQMVPRVTNGAGRVIRELTTNDNMVEALAFDQTTQEFAQFEVEMPESWDEGTVTFIPVWTAAAGSGNVVFALQGVAESNDDAMDVAFGTEQTSDDTLITANDRHKGPESSAITIAGTPAAGDTVVFTIKRNVASDNLSADAELQEIRLYLTLAAGNDA